MIRYNPISDIELLKKEFSYNFDFTKSYGGYIGIDNSDKIIGKCLFSFKDCDCDILICNCELNDDEIIEGFFRSSLNYCANRNVYMAYTKLSLYNDVLLRLGFKNTNGIYSGDIPTLLKGCCCK